MLSAKARVGANPRPYLRNKNVQWAHLDLSDLAEMDFSAEEFERFRVLPGDLLVCEGGEVGRAAVWRGQIDEIGYQKALHRVRPARGVLVEYLLYAFRWFADTHAFEAFTTGSTINHLPQEDLRCLPLPLPPETEQRRIVVAIEEQFSRLDAAEQSLHDAHRWLGFLRGSVLQVAFTVATEGAACPLGELATLTDGPFGSNLKTSHYTDSGPRVVRLQNIADGVFRDEEAHIDPLHFERLRKHEVLPGDIVAASLGDDAPRACLVPGWLGPAIVKADCIRIRPAAEVDASFLMWMLNSPQVREQAAGLIKGIGRPRLGLGNMKRLSIPVPSPGEQQHIVAEIERRLSLADALSAEVGRAQHRSPVLRRALLERAFTGRLVRQDPSDEPASLLLERIGADRAADPKPKRSGRRRATARA
jgi:type I restriction enzyme S subunit